MGKRLADAIVPLKTELDAGVEAGIDATLVIVAAEPLAGPVGEDAVEVPPDTIPVDPAG
jgi:hypothetical protein